MTDIEKTIEDVTALGYEVGLAHGETYFVSGFGMGTYVNADDDEAWASILDPEGHANRVEWDQNPPPMLPPPE